MSYGAFCFRLYPFIVPLRNEQRGYLAAIPHPLQTPSAVSLSRQDNFSGRIQSIWGAADSCSSRGASVPDGRSSARDLVAQVIFVISKIRSTIGLNRPGFVDTFKPHNEVNQEVPLATNVTPKNSKLKRLFVLGDSHTAAYLTMLHITSHHITSLRLGLKVVEYEQGGCAVVSLLAADPAECEAFREAALEDIEERAKQGDTVFLASLRMPELAGQEWQVDEAAVFAQVLAEHTPEHAKTASISANAVLKRLQDAGLKILIDAPSPLFKAAANRCSDWFDQTNPTCAPGLSMPRSQLEQLHAPQMALLAELYPSLSVWDPLPRHPVLRLRRRRRAVVPDADHLSGHGNRVLEPDFTQHLISTRPPLQRRRPRRGHRVAFAVS